MGTGRPTADDWATGSYGLAAGRRLGLDRRTDADASLVARRADRRSESIA
jgi:hypothetical protein